jgi:predicted DNA-binding protein
VKRSDYEQRTDPKLTKGFAVTSIRLPIELNARLRAAAVRMQPRRGALQRLIWAALDAYLRELEPRSGR